jgi:hypothetical protein
MGCGGLGIVSDSSPAASFTAIGADCPGCRGTGFVKLLGGWGSREGFQHLRPGRLVEVHKLLAPSYPDSLADYLKPDVISKKR